MPSKKPKTPKQPIPSTPVSIATSTLTTFETNCPPFAPFADLVAADFQRIVAQQNVFVAAIESDALYAAYLAAFPDGFNPIVKTRTEHDCSTCKQFIRRVGAVVAAVDDKIHTVWDTAAKSAQHPFSQVAATLATIVRAAAVADIFRTSDKESQFGSRQTRYLDAAGIVKSHDHFYTGEIPRRLRVGSPDAARGEYRTTVAVFRRGLEELTADAVETVLSLIDANNLYRGEEHRRAVVEFQQAQQLYVRTTDKNLFAWLNAHRPAARFRNTVIGTLVQDISTGMDVDAAVRAFETKVAPQNYKRTTAVITPMMVKKAMETIAALGLEPALERRFAVISDVSVRDVLWVDGFAKPLMKGGIGDALMQHASTAAPTKPSDGDNAEAVSVDDFITKILPTATNIELLFKSEHIGNLVSLTAPVHPEPKQLFRWPNDFAWSYGGNVADSIRERVKKAGGRVEGATLRVSLSWFNYDDLDIHVHEPAGRGVSSMRDHIYYGNRVGWTGGTLDVDMNAHTGRTREPVENVVWTSKIPDGAYKIVVNNFCQRETSGAGFVVEIEHGGKLSHFSYNKIVRNREDVHVATLHVRNGVVSSVEPGDPGITAQNVSQTKWGLKTEQFVKVRAVTLSPNYWGDAGVGNKHTFFFLEGCKSDEATRGIYNEFLHSRLEPHRKVFEVIGDKTKCQPVDGALCGVGFSSTKRDAVTVRVQQGKKRRLLSVQIGLDKNVAAAV